VRVIGSLEEPGTGAEALGAGHRFARGAGNGESSAEALAAAIGSREGR
jgi:hypothetical protein